MIRASDAFILAYTKLRVHKVRTGIAVGVSGILFGLIAAVIIIAQGVFTSVDNFSDVGLNNRTIVNVTRSGGSLPFNEYDKREDLSFIAEVEAAHKARIEKKTTAAQKYGIPYVSATEDPSPVMIDPQTKKKVIKESALGDAVVQELANAKRAAEYKPFDIDAYLQKYPSAQVIQSYKPVQPENGLLSYMKKGKESFAPDARAQMYGADNESPALTVLDGSLSKPFISNTAFDASKGEIPVIIPYGAAEKLLGYKKLGAETSTEDRINRLQDVRKRIGEVTAHYCYRNNASQALLAQAVAQKEEIKLGSLSKDYVAPPLIYNAPVETECAAISVASDTRTATQKRQAAQQVLYEKEIDTYIGEPEQHLITVRGVGISSDLGTSGQSSVAEMTQALFSSSLGYGTWNIPSDLLASVPEANRPASVFERTGAVSNQPAFFGYEAFLVELTNKDEARKLIEFHDISSSGAETSIYSYPFGSGVLIADELRSIFTAVLVWVLVVVGGVAVIILASIIGRTVSEGRRESSIFRAIGASRLDIGSVYGIYVLLLSLRVIIFTAVLGGGIALVVEIMYWKEATLGAQLAYASTDLTKEFHLFSLGSPYLLWIAGVIVAAGIIASIIPILLGARRNPIKDMRNEG